ncbi:MAG: hypothetical protein AB8H80_07550 [Planctomycetota bacterium]
MRQPLTSAFAIAPLPDGHLFAHGSQFVQAGFPRIPKVERWGGSGWGSMLPPFGAYVAFDYVAGAVADGVLVSGGLAQPDGRAVQLS